MNETRTIPFEGGELLGVRTEDGKVYLAVKKACLEIGLTKKQAFNEMKKIQNSLLLSQGASNLRLLTNGGEQVALCLKEEFVPMWLAQIRLTPAMQKNNPQAVEKLLRYQLRATQVLHEAFNGTEEKAESFYKDMGLSGKIENICSDMLTLTDRVDTLADRVGTLIDTVTINTHQQQELSKLARSRVSALLGGTASPEYKKMAKTYFKRLWISVCDALHVSTYKDINPKQLESAKRMVSAWMYEG
ncbi:MAG: ORF6C domain-containing protein [Bacteroides sp.]|nr:ORF6C domain-containing protein [Eubacterium sp.]MCM1417630.1 ORF6C domain-containing protein [Roseburia sp.]MCM1461905.1 ORF6C domain-containing protein [Bacteroides sp.]